MRSILQISDLFSERKPFGNISRKPMLHYLEWHANILTRFVISASGIESVKNFIHLFISRYNIHIHNLILSYRCSNTYTWPKLKSKFLAIREKSSLPLSSALMSFCRSRWRPSMAIEALKNRFVLICCNERKLLH